MNKLIELYNMATEIIIKPHNSNIPSPVSGAINICVKDGDGRLQYAKINSEADDIITLIDKLHTIAKAFYEATNRTKGSGNETR